MRQHRVKHTQSCKITGWLPLLITDRSSITKPFVIKPLTQKYLWDLQPGGWSVTSLDYADLYFEHVGWRNNWSHSNTGFDLAWYKGAKFHLFAHEEFAYVFHWDTDYNNINNFGHLAHPAVLMNAVNHVVVMPSKITGRNKVTIRVPPPSAYEQAWDFSATLVKRGGLFFWAAAWLDFRRPFLPQGAFPADQASYWWNLSLNAEKLPRWLGEWGMTSCGKPHCTQGPMVLKDLPAEWEPLQAYIQYSFYFKFGGDILPHVPVSDPVKPEGPFLSEFRQPYRLPSHPENPSRHCIRAEDLDSGGELSRRAFKRLTRPSSSDYTSASESDEGTSADLSLTRCPSPPPKKKAKRRAEIGSRRRKTTPAPRGVRVRERSFVSFHSLLENELGRGLTPEESAQASQIWLQEYARRTTPGP